MIRIKIERPDNQQSLFDEIQYDADDLGAFLGRGVLGAVYQGKADHPPHRALKVAIKVPHQPNSEPAFQEEFETMLHLSSAIQAENNTDFIYTPPILQGRRDDGEIALVMPFYDSQQLLSSEIRRLLNAHEWIEAERIATDAAIGFCRVSAALHQIEKVCTDRKLKDFYLFSSAEDLATWNTGFLDQIQSEPLRHVVIIDWNVLRDASSLKALVDGSGHEIRLLGQLWQELFLGQIHTPPLHPFNDSEWVSLVSREIPDGALSIGLRLILKHATHPDTRRRFFNPDIGMPDPLRMAEALIGWQALLSQYADELVPEEALRADADKFFKHIPLTQPERKAVLADLAQRIEPENAEWQGQRTAAMQQVAQQRSGVRQNIAEFLRELKSQDAEDALRTELDPLQNELKDIEVMKREAADFDYAEYGHLERWSRILLARLSRKEAIRNAQATLLEIGQGLDHSFEFDQPERLTEYLEGLNRILHSSVFASDFDNNQISPEYRNLGEIQNEIELRLAVFEYRKQEKDQDKVSLAERQRVIEKIRKLLVKGDKSFAPTYVYPVESPPAAAAGTLLGFDLSAIEQAIETQLRYADQIKDEFDAIVKGLKDAAQRSPLIISEMLRRDFYEFVRRYGENDQPTKAVHQLLRFEEWANSDGYNYQYSLDAIINRSEILRAESSQLKKYLEDIVKPNTETNINTPSSLTRPSLNAVLNVAKTLRENHALLEFGTYRDRGIY